MCTLVQSRSWFWLRKHNLAWEDGGKCDPDHSEHRLRLASRSARRNKSNSVGGEVLRGGTLPRQRNARRELRLTTWQCLSMLFHHSSCLYGRGGPNNTGRHRGRDKYVNDRLAHICKAKCHWKREPTIQSVETGRVHASGMMVLCPLTVRLIAIFLFNNSTRGFGTGMLRCRHTD